MADELVRLETSRGEPCCSTSRTCVGIAADIKSRRRPYQVTYEDGMSQRSRTVALLQYYCSISAEKASYHSSPRHLLDDTCQHQRLGQIVDVSSASSEDQQSLRARDVVRAKSSGSNISCRPPDGRRALREPGTAGRRRMRSGRRARCRVSWAWCGVDQSGWMGRGD